MFDELLEKVKAENFVIKEIVTDKDSSGNAIFCNHFPEGLLLQPLGEDTPQGTAKNQANQVYCK